MVSDKKSVGFIGGAVDFWSSEGAFDNALDAVGWGITNPVTVGKSIVESDVTGSIAKDYEDGKEVIKTAALTGTMYLVKAVAVVGVAYIIFTSLTAYSNKKLEKLAL